LKLIAAWVAMGFRSPKITWGKAAGERRQETSANGQFRYKDALIFLDASKDPAMTPLDSRFQSAIEAIDQANASDPRTVEIGGIKRPFELVYADRMTARLASMYPNASELLRLAARAQHLRRFDIPRENYPLGRTGYNDWRRACREHHVALVSKILADNTYTPDEITRVALLIRKDHLKTDIESQALENVVGVVFIEHYFDSFLTKHASYDETKIASILGKTLRKMSPDGHAAVLSLSLPDAARRLILTALAKGQSSID
jgi:hypothetical protein